MDSPTLVALPPIEIARQALAAVLERDIDDVAPAASLETDLGLDSISIVETLVVIEEEYGVAMPSAETLIRQGVGSVAELGAAIEDAIAKIALARAG